MQSRWARACLLLAAVLIVLPGTADAQGRLGRELKERAARPGTSRVIVQFDRESRADNAVRSVRGKRVKRLRRAHVIEVDNSQLDALAAEGTVTLDRLATGNLYRSTGTIGSDVVNRAMQVTGKGVGIALIDSGYTYHDDLNRRHNSLAAWKDFVRGISLPYDDWGHGTHLAGIISGDGYDSNGRHAGVAPDAKILALKVLNDRGVGYVSDIIAAIEWTIDNRERYNARIINISASAPVLESFRQDPLCDAVQDAVEAGITVVASAGNLGRTADGKKVWGGVGAPGNCPAALTVGASSSEGDTSRLNDIMASFSSRGPTRFDALAKPDVAAPATGVVAPIAPLSRLYREKSSALFDGTVRTLFKPYLALSGTSQAAAEVSGAVALMLQANPLLTPNLVKATLQYTAEFNPQFHALEQGAGFVDARGAVTLAEYLLKGAPGSTYPSEPSWSKTVIWGNLRVSGGVLAPNANAWAWDVLWGASQTPRGAKVIWGDNCANSLCVGATRGDGSIWQTVRGSYADDNIVWGNSYDENIVWGNYWDDNIVWGNYSDDNIVWGNYYDDNIVWGNTYDDNIVWGNSYDDNIVWGNYNDDNIVWGNYNDDNIVWGNYDDDNIVWGN